jgi:hypothetical protein
MRQLPDGRVDEYISEKAVIYQQDIQSQMKPQRWTNREACASQNLERSSSKRIVYSNKK